MLHTFWGVVQWLSTAMQMGEHGMSRVDGVEATVQLQPEPARRRRCERALTGAALSMLALLAACSAPSNRPDFGAADSSLQVHAVTPLEEMIALVDRGDFAAAERAIDAAISSEIGAPHEALRFERERMRRIAMDFGLTRDDAI